MFPNKLPLKYFDGFVKMMLPLTLTLLLNVELPFTVKLLVIFVLVA